MGCPATAYRTSPVLPRGHMCPVGGARNGLRLDSAVRPTACFPLPAKASPQSRNRKSEKTTLCPNPAWKPREAKEGASNSGPTRPSGIFGSQIHFQGDVLSRSICPHAAQDCRQDGGLGRGAPTMEAECGLNSSLSSSV